MSLRISLSIDRYEDSWRYATRLRLAAWDTKDPELFRQAAAEYRDIENYMAAESCDRRAEHYERLEGDAS